MNCCKAKREMFLMESGELAGRNIEKLEEHIRNCAECREYRSGVLGIISAARNVSQDRQMPFVTMARIRSAARKRITARKAVFGWPAFRFAACAAVFTLLAGAWLMLQQTGKPDRVNEISIILSMLSENTFQMEGTDEESRLKEVADQLLILEELTMDDLTGEEAVEALPGDSQPTVLQPHNTPGMS